MENLQRMCQKIYTDSFKRVKTLHQLNQCLKEICYLHHIKRFAIAEVVCHESTKELSFFGYSTYPSLWIKYYIEKKCYEYDPVFKSPVSMPFPFYWDDSLVESTSEQEKVLFEGAKEFGIVSGTTIPLTPNTHKNAYLTLLDYDLTDKFDVMFWLRAAGNAYLDKREKIISLKNEYFCLESSNGYS